MLPGLTQHRAFRPLKTRFHAATAAIFSAMMQVAIQHARKTARVTRLKHATMKTSASPPRAMSMRRFQTLCSQEVAKPCASSSSHSKGNALHSKMNTQNGHTCAQFHATKSSTLKEQTQKAISPPRNEDADRRKDERCAAPILCASQTTQSLSRQVNMEHSTSGPQQSAEQDATIKNACSVVAKHKNLKDGIHPRSLAHMQVNQIVQGSQGRSIHGVKKWGKDGAAEGE